MGNPGKDYLAVFCTSQDNLVDSAGLTSGLRSATARFPTLNCKAGIRGSSRAEGLSAGLARSAAWRCIAPWTIPSWFGEANPMESLPFSNCRMALRRFDLCLAGSCQLLAAAAAIR